MKSIIHIYREMTLNLKSNDIQNLDLNIGSNKIVYEVENHKQEARIFLYKSDQKIVLIDFDGTITKSDVMGLMTGLIYDWTHDGVIRLINAF